jgi:hypothetical protein
MLNTRKAIYSIKLNYSELKKAGPIGSAFYYLSDL